jgi:hypothetical protein
VTWSGGGAGATAEGLQSTTLLSQHILIGGRGDCFVRSGSTEAPTESCQSTGGDPVESSVIDVEHDPSFGFGPLFHDLEPVKHNLESVTCGHRFLVLCSGRFITYMYFSNPESLQVPIDRSTPLSSGGGRSRR